jgi:hypothetical protein
MPHDPVGKAIVKSLLVRHRRTREFWEQAAIQTLGALIADGHRAINGTAELAAAFADSLTGIWTEKWNQEGKKFEHWLEVNDDEEIDDEIRP